MASWSSRWHLCRPGRPRSWPGWKPPLEPWPRPGHPSWGRPFCRPAGMMPLGVPGVVALEKGSESLSRQNELDLSLGPGQGQWRPGVRDNFGVSEAGFLPVLRRGPWGRGSRERLGQVWQVP